MNGFPWLTVAGAVPLLGAIVIMGVPGLVLWRRRRTSGRGTRWPSGWRWRSRW